MAETWITFLVFDDASIIWTHWSRLKEMNKARRVGRVYCAAQFFAADYLIY